MLATDHIAADAQIDLSYLPVGVNPIYVHLIHGSLGRYESAPHGISIGPAAFAGFTETVGKPKKLPPYRTARGLAALLELGLPCC